MDFAWADKVIDADGRPIEFATINLQTSYRYKSKWQGSNSGLGMGGFAGTCQTDADGRFESGPLWPGMSYRVTATATGYGKAEAPQSFTNDTEIVQLKPLVLARAPSRVQGIVVDTRGEPLADVRMFAAGAGWQMATAYTDSAGEFEMAELAPDPRYVLADKDGYRLGGARIDGATPLKIILRGNDEAPRGIPANRLPGRGSQLNAVRRIVERAWNLPMTPRITSRIGLLQAMAQVDMDAALVMSESAGGHFNSVVHIERAQRSIARIPKRR